MKKINLILIVMALILAIVKYVGIADLSKAVICTPLAINLVVVAYQQFRDDKES